MNVSILSEPQIPENERLFSQTSIYTPHLTRGERVSAGNNCMAEE